MIYHLSRKEKSRMIRATTAVLAIPFIDDVEDYIWEAVFGYAKNIPLTDPLTSIRSKRLFDIVDQKRKIGWSAKALQCNVAPGCEFELVIQRADIFKKGRALGFRSLSKSSPPSTLGAALYKHWYGLKVLPDANLQGVEKKRVCILLKSGDRKKFAYLEEDILEHKASDLEWKWTDSTQTGLQGITKKDGFLAFRWYPNQKQLFERFKLPKNSFIFQLEPKRLTLDEAIRRLGT